MRIMGFVAVLLGLFLVWAGVQNVIRHEVLANSGLPNWLRLSYVQVWGPCLMGVWIAAIGVLRMIGRGPSEVKF